MSTEDVVTVERAAEVGEELAGAFRRLLPQLSASARPPTLDELKEMVEAPGTALLLAREQATGEVVGSLTLVVFRVPTGVRAWIEDVVVESSARGRGIGEALSREALRLASARGARTVDLSSRPLREAAGRLYRRLGFLPCDTIVYRYTAPAEA